MIQTEEMSGLGEQEIPGIVLIYTVRLHLTLEPGEERSNIETVDHFHHPQKQQQQDSYHGSFRVSMM